MDKVFWVQNEHCVVIDIYVQPGAKISQIIGKHGDRLKLKIGAPPIDGKANQAVIDFFAKLLNLTKNNIAIVSGEKSRNKRVSLIGNVPFFIQQIEELIND